MLTQDDLIDQVGVDQRLRETQQSVEKDQHCAQHTFAPVPGPERPQVAEIGSNPGPARWTGQAVRRLGAGQSLPQIIEPGVQVLNFARQDFQ